MIIGFAFKQKKQISRLVLKFSKYRFSNFDFNKLNSKMGKESAKDSEFTTKPNESFDFIKKPKNSLNSFKRYYFV